MDYFSKLGFSVIYNELLLLIQELTWSLETIILSLIVDFPSLSLFGEGFEGRINPSPKLESSLFFSKRFLFYEVLKITL